MFVTLAADFDFGEGEGEGKESGGEGGIGVYSVCAWPSSYDHRPSHPYYLCRDGARRIFTNQADIACTKRKVPL